MCACSGIPVLLVDEDPVFREALAENLRSDGHDVFDCPTAGDALPAMRVRTFVAMVTEYVVPGSNGVRLADQFRVLHSGPTVLVTAQSTGTVAAHVEVRQYVQLLVKPVEYDRLHSILHDLVGLLSS